MNVHASDLTIANSTGLTVDLRAPHTESFRLAPHLYLPAFNSTARFESDSVPAVARANGPADSLITVSIIAAADTFVDEPSPVQLTESRSTLHHHWRPELDTVPDLQAPFSSPADANDENHTLAPIVASTASGVVNGDITRVFSSRHSTSIAISRVLASTADADGASNTDSTTAGSKRTFSDRSDRVPTRTYRCMEVENSPKSTTGADDASTPPAPATLAPHEPPDDRLTEE